MRKQLVQTVENLMSEDPRLVLLLGDIGVFGFRGAFDKYPDRAFNIGILEQSTISLAAGLSMTDFIPIVHTIAPFLIERSLEQLKNDFCYQQLPGNFVSVGASYDYAALGCTHHCPGDVGILKNLPGMEIVIPGTAPEFDLLFRKSFSNDHPTYFRLSEQENSVSFDVEFGRAEVIQVGSQALAIAVGPALRPVLEAVQGMDVTLLYYTCVYPFDAETLKTYCSTSKILLCEPYYSGILTSEIVRALFPKPLQIDCLGVPLHPLTNYGRLEEHDEMLGFTARHVRERLERLIHG